LLCICYELIFGPAVAALSVVEVHAKPVFGSVSKKLSTQLYEVGGVIAELLPLLMVLPDFKVMFTVRKPESVRATFPLMATV
jgi:hypothetical protein